MTVLLAGLLGYVLLVPAHAPPVEPVVSTGPAVAAVDLPLVAPTGTVLATRSVVVDGLRRTSVLVRPAAPQRRVLPLVVVLHGRGQSPGAAVTVSGLGFLATHGRAVLLYPEGLGASWNAGHGCCGPAALRRPDDAAFVDAAVADVREHVDIDPRRIALVGYSNGGKLAYALTCDPDRPFVALATYGAVPLAPCAGPRPPRPMSYLLAAGTADTVMPYGGRSSGATPEPPVDQAVAWLRQRDRCPPAPTAADATWRCAAGTRVVLRTYPGHGHSWPTGRDGPPMADVISAFLAGSAI
ncbi:alpha/beta hydrolase family esterase [Actinomycetospora sp. CA-084318]|uniref:alpha/beta hydrolase family esterase n=1 Tax=Actinomycetospora sp. CA-084318 TaxID=3239892 RepID=UPI003D973A23